MAMKIEPIKGFGSKLMVASRAVNTIPSNYLSYSRNARIFDGGIGPRRGKSALYVSQTASNNNGGFSLNGKLYQIAEGKIYEVSTIDGTRTEKASLGYDQRVDVMTYQAQRGAYTSLTASETYSYSVPEFVGWLPAPAVGRITYVVENGIAKMHLLPRESVGNQILATINLTTNNGAYAYPVIKFKYSGTSDSIPGGGNGGYSDGTYYVVSPGIDGGRTADMHYVSLYDTDRHAGNIEIAVGYYVSKSKILIASPNQTLRMYDGETTVSVVGTAPADNSGILEFCRGYSFLAVGNVLYVSRPVTATNPEYAYDFTGTGSQQISYETEIVALKSTLNGLYVLTKNRAEFLGANALQNVAGSATFISTPIGEGAEPLSPMLVVAVGDKIIHMTKNLQVQTINYVSGIENPSLGELSARPVISIKEFLNTVDSDQPSGFAFYNERDKTAQFHIRSVGSPFNDYVLVYDLVNDTWNVDTNKCYNYVVRHGDQFFGYSDVNTSIYEDDVGYSDAGTAIEFRIRTQNMNYGTPFQKRFGGLYVMGGIGALTGLNVLANVDGDNVFEDVIKSNPLGIPTLGEIGGDEIGGTEIGWPQQYFPKLYPFDRIADEGRIFACGKRFQIEIYSYSQVQDFVIDSLGVKYETTGFADVTEKF